MVCLPGVKNCVLFAVLASTLRSAKPPCDWQRSSSDALHGGRGEGGLNRRGRHCLVLGRGVRRLRDGGPDVRRAKVARAGAEALVAQVPEDVVDVASRSSLVRAPLLDLWECAVDLRGVWVGQGDRGGLSGKDC